MTRLVALDSLVESSSQSSRTKEVRRHTVVAILISAFLMYEDDEGD